MKTNFYRLLLVYFFGASLTSAAQSGSGGSFKDENFIQESALIYSKPLAGIHSFSLSTDQTGKVQVLEGSQLLRPTDGYFQHWGTLVPDRSYLPMKDKKVQAVYTYQDQTVYLDDQAVFSNAWAGTLFLKHQLKTAWILEGGKDFDFLISDGKQIQYLTHGYPSAPIKAPKEILSIQFDPIQETFWLLSKESLYRFDAKGAKLVEEFAGKDFTALTLFPPKNHLIIGTGNGYFSYDIRAKKQSSLNTQIPWTEIKTLATKGSDLWFGTSKGAFALHPDGTFSYYYLERWLPGEQVLDIAFGKDRIYLLTDQGLGVILQEEINLAQKAAFLDEYMRKNHLRNGFNASLDLQESGKIETGLLRDSDNDGLWTAMYLASQGFRYAVTKDQEALDQIQQSLMAMERLYTVNAIEGFPSRSFERAGYIERLSDPERWQHSPDPEWDWKSTTSSDEVIGHIFVFGVLAEVVQDDWVRNKSIELIDTLMTHILDHDLYLIDFDGKPTLWGKWNPDYVNQFPIQVGDRKLNSSNIISMLQTAYHFTGKEKYKSKAFELINEHGYLENLMRPMAIIGQSGEGSDSYSQMLSEAWNHSDDEMYYMGYWGLYRYAFNEELKSKYKESIIDHWQAERPEKEGLWNIMTALVQPEKFDLDESIWFLQKHPIDLINWNVKNSHRKDIQNLPANFRRQTTSMVLSPAETKIARHNANRFNLDANGNGKSVYSPGDIWLLPYWMGRYLQVIR